MADRIIYTQKTRNAPMKRRLDRGFVRWVLAAACAGAMVTVGYVYSARCHMEAVRLGYETQKQREQLERQELERRRLEFERTRVLAPEQLEMRARKIGLRLPESPATEYEREKSERRGGGAVR